MDVTISSSTCFLPRLLAHSQFYSHPNTNQRSNSTNAREGSDSTWLTFNYNYGSLTPINWLTILHYRRRWSHATSTPPGIRAWKSLLELKKTEKRPKVNRRFPRNEKILIKQKKKKEKKQEKKIKKFPRPFFFFSVSKFSFNFDSRSRVGCMLNFSLASESDLNAIRFSGWRGEGCYKREFVQRSDLIIFLSYSSSCNNFFSI